MAIEHRDIDGVLGAFRSTGLAKMAIWQGTIPVMVYDGDDLDEAEQKLDEWLNFIQNGGTTAQYMLKMYPDDSKNITNRTPFRCATRFQLTPAAGAQYTQTADGKVIMLRDVNRTPAVAATNNTGLTERLDKLERENRDLMERLHTEQLNNLRTEFKATIAGIASAQPQLTIVDKIDQIIDKLLNKVEPIFNIVHKIRGTNHDYIVNRTSPVAGTKNKGQVEEKDDTQEQETIPAEPVLYTLLTPEQQKLPVDDRNALIVPILEALSTDDLDELQMACIERLEARISAVTVTRVLLVVDALDDKGMNKLLNNLD